MKINYTRHFDNVKRDHFSYTMLDLYLLEKGEVFKVFVILKINNMAPIVPKPPGALLNRKRFLSRFINSGV